MSYDLKRAKLIHVVFSNYTAEAYTYFIYVYKMETSYFK